MTTDHQATEHRLTETERELGVIIAGLLAVASLVVVILFVMR